MLGVSDKTVGIQRQELERTAEIPQFKICVGADGKKRPRQVARKPVSVFNPTKHEEKALQNPEVVARLQEQNSRASLSHLAPLSAVVISTYKNINAERF